MEEHRIKLEAERKIAIFHVTIAIFQGKGNERFRQRGVIRVKSGSHLSNKIKLKMTTFLLIT